MRKDNQRKLKVLQAAMGDGPHRFRKLAEALRPGWLRDRLPIPQDVGETTQDERTGFHITRVR